MKKKPKVLKSRLNNLLSEKLGFKVKPFYYFSPGRINLIGEHVDYAGTGGLVMPAAVNLGITAAALKHSWICVYSENYSDLGWVESKISLSSKYDPVKGFLNMVNGAYKILDTIGKKPGGMILALSSTIPSASGMSSSAAFCVLILTVLNDLYRLDLNSVDVALLSQRIENEYIGLHSGIMDQFVVSSARKNHFMVLDTATLKHSFVNFPTRKYKFFVVNTHKSRVLATSAYNQRVEELRKVMSIFHSTGNRFKLLSEANDQKYLDLISDNVLRRRFKHVITEMRRVDLTRRCLASLNGVQLGAILNESHASLRDDYEVSCDEADFLHFKLLSTRNVHGARIMGAGFGGCLIVVASTKTTKRQLDFKKEYFERFGLKMEVYEFETADGASKI